MRLLPSAPPGGARERHAASFQGRPSRPPRQAGRQCRRQVAADDDKVFPQYEGPEGDIKGSLLPRRDPGSFPNIRTQRGGLTGALTSFKETFWDDAEAKYAVVDESGEKPFDPLRDGPLRYLGYANEVGEAFAAWLPALGVPLSYAVAITYVLVDTGDKGLAAYREAGAALEGNAALPAEVDRPRLTALLATERTLDTLVWQLLASVALPGFTIHTVVAFVHALLQPVEGLSTVQQAAATLASGFHTQAGVVTEVGDKTVPTLFGLATIPFIVHPLDNAVHALLNVTLRPAMRDFVCGRGQGKLAALAQCAACGAKEPATPR